MRKQAFAAILTIGFTIWYFRRKKLRQKYSEEELKNLEEELEEEKKNKSIILINEPTHALGSSTRFTICGGNSSNGL